MKTWFIPGNVPSSKNSRQWTGKFFIASKTTQKYRKDSEQHWIAARDSFLESVKDLPKPYHIAFEFIRGSKHKFDYINPLQTVQDEMVKYGWIEDDNADILLPMVLPYKYDKEKPGVIIHVIKLYNEKDQ